MRSPKAREIFFIIFVSTFIFAKDARADLASHYNDRGQISYVDYFKDPERTYLVSRDIYGYLEPSGLMYISQSIDYSNGDPSKPRRVIQYQLFSKTGHTAPSTITEYAGEDVYVTQYSFLDGSSDERVQTRVNTHWRTTLVGEPVVSKTILSETRYDYIYNSAGMKFAEQYTYTEHYPMNFDFIDHIKSQKIFKYELNPNGNDTHIVSEEITSWDPEGRKTECTLTFFDFENGLEKEASKTVYSYWPSGNMQKEEVFLKGVPVSIHYYADNAAAILLTRKDHLNGNGKVDATEYFKADGKTIQHTEVYDYSPDQNFYSKADYVIFQLAGEKNDFDLNAPSKADNLVAITSHYPEIFYNNATPASLLLYSRVDGNYSARQYYYPNSAVCLASIIRESFWTQDKRLDRIETRTIERNQDNIVTEEKVEIEHYNEDNRITHMTYYREGKLWLTSYFEDRTQNGIKYAFRVRNEYYDSHGFVNKIEICTPGFDSPTQITTLVNSSSGTCLIKTVTNLSYYESRRPREDVRRSESTTTYYRSPDKDTLQKREYSSRTWARDGVLKREIRESWAYYSIGAIKVYECYDNYPDRDKFKHEKCYFSENGLLIKIEAFDIVGSLVSTWNRKSIPSVADIQINPAIEDLVQKQAALAQKRLPNQLGEMIHPGQYASSYLES